MIATDQSVKRDNPTTPIPLHTTKSAKVMAPIRRYLRITRYSVLEVRIYLDNPALANSWLLNSRDPVLPRVIEAVRPLVLPKLREENENAKKKGGKKKRGVRDVVVQGMSLVAPSSSLLWLLDWRSVDVKRVMGVDMARCEQQLTCHGQTRRLRSLHLPDRNLDLPRHAHETKNLFLETEATEQHQQIDELFQHVGNCYSG